MITECQNIIVGQLDNWSSSSCDVIVYVLTVKLSAWKFLSSVLYSLSGNKILIYILKWSGSKMYITYRLYMYLRRKKGGSCCLTLVLPWSPVSRSLFLTCYVHDPFAFSCIEMLCTQSFRFEWYWKLIWLEFGKLSRNSLAWIRS